MFSLDGKMDMEIELNDKVMKITMYIKMDAHDQLLLSDGVYRQLGIVSSDRAVQVWKGGKERRVMKGQNGQSKAVTVCARVVSPESYSQHSTSLPIHIL